MGLWFRSIVVDEMLQALGVYLGSPERGSRSHMATPPHPAPSHVTPPPPPRLCAAQLSNVEALMSYVLGRKEGRAGLQVAKKLEEDLSGEWAPTPWPGIRLGTQRLAWDQAACACPLLPASRI